MADEARLNELLDLVEQARAEGDKATEAKAIAAYRAESQPTKEPESYPGAGGYNPMTSMLGGGAINAGAQLGMTPENIANPIANATAPAEAAMQFASGGAAMIPAGLAGLGQGVKNLFSPGMPAADRVRQVEQALTYQPRTGAGQGMATTAMAPLQAYGAGTNYLGEKATDITGSPALGAAVKTAGDFAPALFARGEGGPARPKGNYTSGKVPTTAELSKAAGEAYKRADDSGIAVKAESFEKMRDALTDELKKAGLNAKLHPQATAALEELAGEKGPVSLQRLETLRRIASDAADTFDNPANARKANQIIDAMDEHVDGLADSDLVSGAAKDASALKEARALYTRKRKAQDIERLMERAKHSASGFENGLRIEFRSLAKNDRKLRRFNAEEQAAIKKVADGGKFENALRLLGKAAPTGIVSGGLSSGAGFAFGGPVGAVALPAAGIAGRLGAKALTTRNAQQAAELMRRGPYQPPPPLNIPKPQPMTGELMPREPLALPAPNIISGARSAPGSMYARQQMGMTPDVEAAGMQHPGMARQSVPAQPKQLTYQPEPVAKPMVADSQGRVAPSAADLNTYLRDMGLNVSKNAGNGKKSVFDAVETKPSSSAATAPAPARSSTQIKLELQRLLVQMRSAPAGGDALYAQGLKRHWDQLQGELRQQLSRESSGVATSRRPTK